MHAGFVSTRPNGSVELVNKVMFLNNLVIEPSRGRGRALRTKLGSPMSKAAPKVLVADDDEDSRRLLCEVLEANGYEVGAVGDGLAARETLSRDGGYGIVIADLRMPNESGLELIQNLRKQKLNYHFILMSSFISGPERELAKELGAHALLEKPFRLSDLLDRVAELVSKNTIGISP